MKKIKPIHIEAPKPRDPNWKDLAASKARPFVDRKKKADKDCCREKVEDE